MQIHRCTRSNLCTSKFGNFPSRSLQRQASLEFRDVLFLLHSKNVTKTNKFTHQLLQNWQSPRRKLVRNCEYQLTFDECTPLVVAAAAVSKKFPGRKKNQFRSRLSLLLFHRNERNKNFLLPFCTIYRTAGWRLMMNVCVHECNCVLMGYISGTTTLQ